MLDAPGQLLICKLPPATTMTVPVDGQISHRVYWTLDATRLAQPLSEAEWLDAMRSALVRALDRRRLSADVPVGVLVSGGLDSSLLVGLLPDHVRPSSRDRYASRGYCSGPVLENEVVTNAQVVFIACQVAGQGRIASRWDRVPDRRC